MKFKFAIELAIIGCILRLLVDSFFFISNMHRYDFIENALIFLGIIGFALLLIFFVVFRTKSSNGRH